MPYLAVLSAMPPDHIPVCDLATTRHCKAAVIQFRACHRAYFLIDTHYPQKAHSDIHIAKDLRDLYVSDYNVNSYKYINSLNPKYVYINKKSTYKNEHCST